MRQRDGYLPIKEGEGEEVETQPSTGEHTQEAQGLVGLTVASLRQRQPQARLVRIRLVGNQRARPALRSVEAGGDPRPTRGFDRRYRHP